MRGLIEGESNKSIARKIDIAEATVKVHVKAILRKIRVQNRTQAAIWGMNNRASSFQPSISNATPIAAISEIKQIGGPGPVEVLNHETNHAEVVRYDGLIRKDINPRTVGAARVGK